MKETKANKEDLCVERRGSFNEEFRSAGRKDSEYQSVRRSSLMKLESPLRKENEEVMFQFAQRYRKFKRCNGHGSPREEPRRNRLLTE